MDNSKVRHKQSKHFTVMLIPDSSSKVRSLRIPRWIFYVLMSLVFTFVVLIGISRHQAEALKRTQSEKGMLLNQKIGLENEKGHLEGKLEQFGDKADELQSQLEELERMKDDLYGSIDGVLSRPGAPAITLQARVLVKSEQIPTGTGEDAVEARLAMLSQSLKSSLETYAYLREVSQELRPFIDAYPQDWPVPPKNVSEYGVRGNPFGGTSMEFHNAVDIPVNSGTRVKATGGGVVEFAGWRGNYGYLVILNHGYGIQTYYAHNSRLLVQVGDEVSRGDAIAQAGSTGRSTGPHVHYEVRLNGAEQNPRDFIIEE